MGIFLKDSESRFVAASRATAEIMALPDPGILIGKTDHDFHPKELADEYLADERKAMSTKTPLVGKTESKMVAGEYRWLFVTKLPVFTEAGAPLGFVGILQDATEQKRVERALIESEQRFSTVFRHAPMAIAILRASDGRFVDVNDRFVKETGYAREEILGHTAAELNLQPEGGSHEPILRALAERGELDTREFKSRRKSGEVGYGLSATAGVGLGGELHYLSMVVDITERKNAEEALRRLNRELVAISKCNQVLIRAVDEQIMINDICRVICEDAGYLMVWVGSAENDVEKTIRPVAWAGQEEGYLEQGKISWGDSKHGRGPAGEAVRTGSMVCVQDAAADPRFDPWRESAEQRGFRSTIALPLKDENGDTFGVLGIYSGEVNAFTPDETRLLDELSDDLAFGIIALRTRAERKRAEAALRESEEQLRQAQKMEAVGQLAGGVAHDFNNLLTVISGCSEMVMGSLEEGDPNRELMAQIQKAGDRAANLIRQLLAFSRKQVLQPQVVNLNTLIDGLRKMIERLIGENIELTVDPAENLGMAKVDAAQFEQVIVNLAVNARDAMPDGGRLRIETHNSEIDDTYARHHAEVKPGRYVQVAVSDVGQGMDEATLAHIFEPFFTTKAPGKGTGLGLSMAYGFVKQSGGHIEVFSQSGRGTTFIVYLPRTEEKPHSKAARPKLESPKGTETILLVEDEDSLRNLTGHMLQSNGYVVLEARDGQEAIEIADKHPGAIQLLVTDLVMPRLSGRQLAERLRRTRNAMRVLFISGYSDEEATRQGALESSGAFLQKPFNANGLFRKVRAVLDAGSTPPSAK